jgi:hypothetical protein
MAQAQPTWPVPTIPIFMVASDDDDFQAGGLFPAEGCYRSPSWNMRTQLRKHD